MPGVCELVTTSVFNRETDEVENKTSNVSGLVKKIMTLNYQTSNEDISLFLIITNLRVTYLMQR